MDFDDEELDLPKEIIELIKKKNFMDLINYYQKPGLNPKKITRFSKKTKGKQMKSTKKITKFHKKPQAIVKEKLQVIAHMENEMKKLQADIEKLSSKDPIKPKKELKLKKLSNELNSLKKSIKLR